MHQNLPITRQFDGYNCSIFAVNAVGCNALPEHISLLETSTHADEIQIVMYRARLGSKARALARLDQAQAWIEHEPSPSQGLRLGSGWARAQAWAL